MSSNPLNDLSQVYLDQVANVKKAENEADIQRWEEIGGPTPDNYKPTGGSAKIKTESTNRSDWRTDIFEAGDPDATQTPGFKKEKDSAKKVKEVSGINNKVLINPKLNEAIKEIGGEVIVAEEVEEIDEDDQTRQQQLQRKQLMIDRQKLQLRRRAMGKKKKENNDGGSETEAQANVIANEGAMTMIGKTKKKVEKKPEKAMDAGSRAKRMLARKIHAKYVSGSTENVPDDIAEAKVDKGRSDYGKASIRNYRRSGPGHGEPAMFDSENKRGKTIDKRREEHKGRRGVKGAKVPAYKVDEAVKGQDTSMRKMAAQDRAAGIDKRLSPKEGKRSVKPVRYRYNEGEDKAFNYVVAKLKKQHGDGVLTKGDKMPQPSAADKAKARAHQAKVDAENAAERKKDPSQGRYPKG
tara:strand:- start:133 stop:1359 length:1227 start_codon:yes stop_codon:yes gene_type:complete